MYSIASSKLVEKVESEKVELSYVVDDLSRLKSSVGRLFSWKIRPQLTRSLRE